MAIDEDGVIEEKTPRSIFTGTLKLGDASIDCHYLDNGKRVFTQREMVRYFRGPENSHLSRYVERNPLIPRDFLVGQNIIFNVPGNPQPVYGYEATVLIDFCSYYAEALQKGLLKDKWIKLGVLAVATLIACAKTGIIALHDEATGFQRHRDRNALETKFKFFFLDEMSVWVRRFPDEFWVEIARLEGVVYDPNHRPLRWGKFVMVYVYDAIDPDVGNYLREKNPEPRYGMNHHQLLKKIGLQKLEEQVERLIFMMQDCMDMGAFKRRFKHKFGDKDGQRDLFDFYQLEELIKPKKIKGKNKGQNQ